MLAQPICGAVRTKWPWRCSASGRGIHSSSKILVMLRHRTGLLIRRVAQRPARVLLWENDQENVLAGHPRQDSRSVATGTRVPLKTGVPPRISGEDSTTDIVVASLSGGSIGVLPP